MSRPVGDFFKEFRPDGWPLCPQCGQDELYSHIRQPAPEDATMEEWLEAGLTCYACQFHIKLAEGAIERASPHPT